MKSLREKCRVLPLLLLLLHGPTLPSLKLSYRLLLLLADKGPPSFVYLLLPRHGRRGKGRGGRGNCQKFFCPTDFSSPSSVSQQGTRERGLLGGARQSPPFSLSSKSTPLSGPSSPLLPPIKRSLSPSLRRSSISLPPRPRSSFPKEGKTKVALSPPPPFLSPPVRKTPAPNKFPAKFPIRHEKGRRGSRETSQFRNTARHSWIKKGGTLGWKERISLAVACGASEEDSGGEILFVGRQSGAPREGNWSGSGRRAGFVEHAGAGTHKQQRSTWKNDRPLANSSYFE